MRMILTIQVRKKGCFERNNQETINDAGYEFTQLKFENKWRSLVQSHKDIKDSKKKTGEKRKTFLYHERLENSSLKDMTFSPYPTVQV